VSVVKTAILVELQERITKSQEYDSLCSTAKTSTKKNFYKKKLIANNNIVADLIVALEKLNKNNKNGEADGTPEPEGHPESASSEQ